MAEIDPLAFQKGFQATQTVFDNAQRNRLQELAMRRADEAYQQDQAVNRLYAAAVGPDGTIDRAKLLTGFAQGGLGAKIPALQTQFANQDKSQMEARKAQLENGLKQFEAMGQLFSGVQDQAGYDAARQQAVSIIGPEAASRIPAQYDPQQIAQGQAQALSVKDRMAQELQRLQFGETMRHNRATEGISSEQARTSMGQLKVAQERLAFEQTQPRGQIVQTDQGTMLVDPRTGQSRAVIDESGQPVQKPGREIPASVNKSIIENQQNIGKIDAAIEAIRKSPNALGTINMLPGAEVVRQYTGSPEDIEARAGVADVGSLILHDRSGAAVTAAETPRLKPFIPSASDRPEVAIKKLERFRQLYQQEASLLSDTYSKEQGYRPSPALGAQKAAASAPAVAEAGKSVGGDQASALAELQRRAATDPALAAKLKAMGY